MATIPPKLVSGPRGVQLSAEWLNQLRDAVAALGNFNVGKGLSITQSESGVLISSATGAPEWKRGVIAAAPTVADELASAIRYDVKVVGIDQVATNLEARIARPAQGAVRLVPAHVGDPCFVLLVPAGDGTFVAWLWAMTETLAFAACSTGPLPLTRNTFDGPPLTLVDNVSRLRGATP